MRVVAPTSVKGCNSIRTVRAAGPSPITRSSSKSSSAGFEVGQDRRQIACLGQHRARGHAKAHAQLPRHDLRQRRLAQTRRPVKQRVIHRLATLAGGLDEDGKVRARLGLTDKFRQHSREFHRGRDLDRWANLTQKQDLCTEAEELAKDSDYPKMAKTIQRTN